MTTTEVRHAGSIIASFCQMGYIGSCTCGWEGDQLPSEGDALEELRRHHEDVDGREQTAGIELGAPCATCAGEGVMDCAGDRRVRRCTDPVCQLHRHNCNTCGGSGVATDQTFKEIRNAE